MAQTLYYSSTAVSMTLSALVNGGDTTCTLSSTLGLPASFPFKLLLDWGAASQEVVYCTALSGNVATIQRGKDGTSATSHSANATVVHGVSAEEFNNADIHRNATQAIHGLAAGSSVVGTTDTQTLTNKTLTLPNISGAAVSGTFTSTGCLWVPSATNQNAIQLKRVANQTAMIAPLFDSDGATVLGGFDSSGNLAPPANYPTWPSFQWLGLTGTTLFSRYTRVGGMVHCEAQVNVATATGSIGINLPVASAMGSDTDFSTIGTAIYSNGATKNVYGLGCLIGGTNAFCCPGGGGNGELFDPGWTTGTLSIVATYFI